jgi:hypothetical protein
MSPSVVARIFKEFHFRSLTPKSSKNLIYKTIVNTAFETIIIVSSYGKDKNIEWSIKGDIADKIPEIQQMITDYAKKVVREIPIEDAMIACEDSDDENPPIVKMEELNPFNWKKWAEGKSGEMTKM